MLHMNRGIFAISARKRGSGPCSRLTSRSTSNISAASPRRRKLLHVPSLSAAKPEDLGSAEFSALPDSGYVIYFVPTDENAGTESVNIPVPAQCRSYFISGSNDGGFIVTAEL